MNTKRFAIAWAWGLLGLSLILTLSVLTSQATGTAGSPDAGNHVRDATLSYSSLGPIADKEITTSTAHLTVPDRRQSCVPPPDGLISWWPGDGEAVDVWDGNDGTLQGGTGFAAGKVGQAFSFDGVDDQVNVGNAANLHVSADEFTILAWVRFDVDDLWPIGDDMSIADKMSNIGLNGDGWRLFRQRDFGNFMFCLGGGGVNGCDHWAPTPPTTVLATTIAQKDIWYHVAGVVGSGEFSIYVNGALEDSKPRPTFTDSNSTDLLIGANAPEGAYLDGLVDEVTLFSRALSAAEIQHIFDAGSGGMCKSMGVFLSPSAQTGSGKTGRIVTYTVQLANQTGVTDSFALSLQPGNAWTTTLSLTQTNPLSDGDSLPFTAWVAIPPWASPGDMDSVTIEAASVTSPTVYSDTATIQTHVICEHCKLFLPFITRNYCPDFFDDFSNPASGWEVVDDRYVRTEYLNGEYRILTKKAGYFYLFRAPTCDRQNYVVEVDARWVGTPGSSYGLVFDVTSGFEQYYLFDINTDYKQFRLLRRDSNGFTVVVPITAAPPINGGTASNHLKVIRDTDFEIARDDVTLEVNGTVLGTWPVVPIGGLTGAGLVTNPYSNNPTSDARFDNFSIASLPESAASAQEPSGGMAGESELAAPRARSDPAPIDMGW